MYPYQQQQQPYGYAPPPPPQQQQPGYPPNVGFGIPPPPVPQNYAPPYAYPPQPHDHNTGWGTIAAAPGPIPPPPPVGVAPLGGGPVPPAAPPPLETSPATFPSPAASLVSMPGSSPSPPPVAAGASAAATTAAHVPPAAVSPSPGIEMSRLNSAKPPSSEPPPQHQFSPNLASSAGSAPSPPSQDPSADALAGKLTSAVGLDWVFSSKRPVSQPSCPPGYEIQYTAKGQPFRVKIDDKGAPSSDEDAVLEHVRESLPLSINAETMEKKFSVGIRLYFDFLKFLILVNFILSIVAFFSFAPHASRINSEWRDKFDNIHMLEKLDYLFIASYQPESRPAWTAMVIFMVIVSFSIGPLYGFYLKRFFQRRQLEDVMDEFVGTEFDLIKENMRISHRQHMLRRVVSWGLFFISLAIPIGVTIILSYYGVKANLDQSNFDKTTQDRIKAGISFACSGTVSVFNVLWEYVCVGLTRFEMHRTWTAFRKSNTFRLVFFKILNAISLFVVRYKVDIHRQPCIASTLGFQFFSFVLLELTVINLIEVFLPIVTNKLFRKKNQKSAVGDEDNRPEFDVAEEYLEIIYRQFMVYIGMTVFPLIAVFAFVNNIVEYWIDKYRLLRICRRPKRINGSMRSLLVFFLIFIAAAGFVSYPTAPLYFAPKVNTICYPCARYSPAANPVFGEQTTCVWSGNYANAMQVSSVTAKTLFDEANNSFQCYCQPCLMSLYTGVDSSNWDPACERP